MICPASNVRISFLCVDCSGSVSKVISVILVVLLSHQRNFVFLLSFCGLYEWNTFVAFVCIGFLDDPHAYYTMLHME